MVLILGIDPGTAIMGYGLVESGASDSKDERDALGGLRPGSERLKMVEYGALLTPANAPLSERLPLLYDGLVKLINEYKPQGMAIEELFFSKNVRTGLSVAHARARPHMRGSGCGRWRWLGRRRRRRGGVCGPC